MNIYLDGQKLESSTGGVSGAFEAARESITDTGRILIRVLADGAPIDPNLIDHPPESDAGIKELEIFSQETSAVLTESLRGASDALTLVKDDQTLAADRLQAGEITEAFEPLARVLETWAAVREIVGQAGELAQIDVGQVVVESKAGQVSGAALIGDLTLRLQAVREAMSGEDWGGLSDELAYELGDQADSWRGLVHAMSGQIGGTDK